MKELEWFLETMKKDFSIKVPANKATCDEIELFHEEIEEVYIPYIMLREMPDPMLFKTIIYTEKNGREWLGTIAMDQASKEWKLLTIHMDDKLAYQKLCI